MNKVYFNKIEEMVNGVVIGADAAASTLGYGGKTVIISKSGLPLHVTKDGVTVLNSIRLSDPMQDAGLKFVQDVSTKTASTVGDGTTTVSVILSALIREGLKAQKAGIDMAKFKNGLMAAVQFVLKSIDTSKIEVDDKMLIQVAAISANNDSELGDMIGEMFMKIGRHGIVHIEDGNQGETTISLVNGFQFIGGYYSPYFINTPANNCELVNPYILIVDEKIDTFAKIRPIIEMAVRNQRAIFIIADDFDNTVLANLLANTRSNKPNALKACLAACPFNGPSKDEFLFDLAAATGAKLISRKTGVKIEKIDEGYLGQCEKIVCEKSETKIFNPVPNKEELEKRVEDAKSIIANAKHDIIKNKAELRLSKLMGKTAICYVGAPTKIEREEKKDRVDDAIRATKAAIEDGVVPGGGSLLAILANRLLSNGISELKDASHSAAVTALANALMAPMITICKNAGIDGRYTMEKMMDSKQTNRGFNAKTGEIEDLVKSGVIDPAKVVKSCVENAASGAMQFLMSSCVIVDEK